MSAFMCTDEHVNRILDAAVAASSSPSDLMYRLPGEQGQSLNERLNLAGRALHLENLRSMLARYPLGADEEFEYRQMAAAFVYVRGGEAQTPVSPVQGLKLALSWRYQSCEHPEPERDKATWDMLHALERIMITALPGYGAAAWSV
jgi:hypothetical protein